jgi:hypothetical protein
MDRNWKTHSSKFYFIFAIFSQTTDIENVELNCSDEKDMLSKLLSVDIEKRPSAQEALNDEWFL